MTNLKEILTRAEQWPASAQEELLRATMVIESNQDADFDLTADDYEILDARIACAAAGEIATEAEVAIVFAKYRPL